MKTNVKICSKCGEEFELMPGKPGFANVCVNCTESPEARANRVAREERLRKERASAAKVNKRSMEKSARDKREREALGIEIIRHIHLEEPLTAHQRRALKKTTKK